MPKRPIQRKISGLPKKLVRLGGLADFLNRDERTVRTYCEKRLIPEAVPPAKKGGHWHLRLPLSVQTRNKIDGWMKPSPDRRRLPLFARRTTKRRKFDDGFDEWLILTDWYPEDGEKLDPRIAKLIQERMRSGVGFADLILEAWMLHIWTHESGDPTATRLAQLMGLSRPAFSRKFPKQIFKQTYQRVLQSVRREEPSGHSGEDPASQYRFE